MNNLDLPPEVARLFALAGWKDGRQAAAPPFADTAHPAEEVLRSFAGLVVRPEKEGVECGASTVSFGSVEVRDPLVAEWEVLLDTKLVPIGECDFGHDALLMATDGRCFGLSYIHEAFYFHGNTLREAITRILTGRRARPMLLPRQSSVTLYGEVFNQNSPSLYTPAAR